MTTRPLEHLDFGHLRIAYDDRVLRPRPWTAAQSEWSAELLASVPPGPVLELCAGAGHIGLLAVAGTGRRLLCVDANEAACELTSANARAAGMADRVEVRHGLLEESLAPGELFPLVVADPPWVPRAETGRYPEDPLLAIDGGDDGLDVARACLAVIDEHLAPGGSAVLQVGTADQVDVLRSEPAVAAARLAVVEVRRFERGALARLDRG